MLNNLLNKEIIKIIKNDKNQQHIFVVRLKFLVIVILLIAVILILSGCTENEINQNNKLNENAATPPGVVINEPEKVAVENNDKDDNQNNEEANLVVKVIDGDTIKLDNGAVVRYIGIDTPETVDPRKPIQCFGQEAAKKNEELVLNKKGHFGKRCLGNRPLRQVAKVCLC